MTRELVLGVLLEVTRDGEYSHISLRNVLTKYQYLDKRDRAFITRVVEGTLEHMIEIDYIINQFSFAVLQDAISNLLIFPHNLSVCLYSSKSILLVSYISFSQ